MAKLSARIAKSKKLVRKDIDKSKRFIDEKDAEGELEKVLFFDSLERKVEDLNNRSGRSARLATAGWLSSSLVCSFEARLHFAFQLMKKQVFGKCRSMPSIRRR